MVLLALLFSSSPALAQSVLDPDVFGHPNCPCTLDNSLIPGGTRVKGIGYGKDCRPWDEKLEYCTEQENADRDSGYNENFEWCAGSWCYVDPDNCDAPVIVDGKEWNPTDDDLLYYGSVVWPLTEGLYYSYQTCGNVDLYSDKDISWIWSFEGCLDRTPNDYYLLVDGSTSVLDEWDDMKGALKTIVEYGMFMDGDRVGMIEFSGHRDATIDNTVQVFDFAADQDAMADAIDDMENLGGHTWTLMGLQQTLAAWEQEADIDEPTRERILLLVTDGRPKPRIPEIPGCVEQMNDLSLPLCPNGQRSQNCRNPNCYDVGLDMTTTDCCPGDQDPCTSEQSDALVQALKDNDVMVVVIAVGKDASNIKTDDGDVLYFGCLLKEDYDQDLDPIAHRIATIDDFGSFFEYQDPTASEEGGVDGQLCIDPVVFLPPAPPTTACTEAPEPKSVVLLLDSSKSMYTTKQRGGTYNSNWLGIMHDLESVICLHEAEDDTCAYTDEDNVGLIAFASQVEPIHHITHGNWFSHLKFTKEDQDGDIVANIDRKKLRYMTDTVKGLHAALDMMAEEPERTYIKIDGTEAKVRREVIIITDGRPHCKRDKDTLCQPCSHVWRGETVTKLLAADCDVKMIWRGDRTLHDATIEVDVDFLRSSEVFGCLPIDFDSDTDFVTIEDFDDADFVDALRGETTCTQMQEGNQ